MTIASVTGAAVRSATGPAFQKFIRSLDDPETAQERLLEWIVADSSCSAYGREFGLSASDTVNSFRKKIPLVSYEELRPWVDRAVFDKEAGVLSARHIVRVEATSGSSSGVKWIPYTRPMMGTFTRMFTLWAHDLLTHLYRPRSGRLFMCVTGGRPEDGSLSSEYVGDDRDYLGKRWRAVLSRFVIAPQFVHADDPLERLAIALDNEPELEVMSFWSPSLLLAVLDRMGIATPEETRRRWPSLQLISCWSAASSESFANKVRELFPAVPVQGKGLLATEASLTIPLEAAGGRCVPLLDDVYLEFIGADGSLTSLHELNEGEEYEVLISNRGGFLRYRLGDRVRVGERFRNTPTLEFVGRAGIVCDLVGEKLTVEFLEREIGKGVAGYFCLLPRERGYEIWVDETAVAEGGENLNRRLCENFHYDRALRLGQLEPLLVYRIDRLHDRIRQCTEEVGGRARAYKPPLLVSNRERADRISQELRRMLAERRG